MLRRAVLQKTGKEDDNGDSGAETAGSDCSKMSSPRSDLGAGPLSDTLVMTVHLLANPGDSLLLQHSLDGLLQWVWPGLRLFQVSERLCPLRDPAPRGHPSLAVTLFLQEGRGEGRGEGRVLRALDLLQRPPWRYHHSESRPRPCPLPGPALYALGAGLPLWGVRSVHCGGEALRVTLYSAFRNYGDAVRLYELVLRRRAQEQKAGFCWFTLQAQRGRSLQLALKRLAPGLVPRPCQSALLQFRSAPIGQLVPLLPHPCTPISASRWQSQDLDGNKILFQVKGEPCSAFPLYPSPPVPGPRRPQTLEGGEGAPGGWERAPGGWESAGSDSSSCYSSQRSSPAPSPFPHSLPDPDPAHSGMLGAESETDVDTGFAVERPAVEGASSLETDCDIITSLLWGSLSQNMGGALQWQGGDQPPPHGPQSPALPDEFFI
ncbi:hypothetical protein COCON_G00184230 [Conger conger]|uniref:FAM124 domain-containing protein n=1 Tax=Conger conger TaxID=82655 RepID=A0A9Q1D269_CONCO|nr:hypothetical protein COCON_G00184230 [Conger conger]